MAVPKFHFCGGDKKLNTNFCIRMQVLNKKGEVVPAYLEEGKNGGLTIPNFHVRDVKFVDATNEKYILFGKKRIYLSDDDACYNSRAEIVKWIEDKVKSRRRWILKKKTSSGSVVARIDVQIVVPVSHTINSFSFSSP